MPKIQKNGTKNRELEEHIIEKTVSNSDEKSVQEKVSEDSRSTKSIVKSVTRRGRGQRAGGGKKLKVIPLGGLHEIGKNNHLTLNMTMKFLF